MKKRLASVVTVLWRYLSDLLWVVAGIIGLVVLVGIPSGRDILPARVGFMLAFASLYAGWMVYKYQTDREITRLKARLAACRRGGRLRRCAPLAWTFVLLDGLAAPLMGSEAVEIGTPGLTAFLSDKLLEADGSTAARGTA